jgi:hypothetical protein
VKGKRSDVQRGEKRRVEEKKRRKERRRAAKRQRTEYKIKAER